MNRDTIELSWDGDQICALVGPNLQEGTAGFGSTPSEALRDLANQMESVGYSL